MRIQTSRGNSYNAEWIDGPTSIEGQLMLEMEDSRRLPEIAEEFDGLEYIERYSEDEDDRTYEGYAALAGITRLRSGNVLIQLAREV